MARAWMRWMVAAGLVLIESSGARAESKPIKDLPNDVAHWSTLWGEIPAQIYEEAIDRGPVSAVTIGPARGAVVMVRDATKELWDAAKGDKRPGHSSPQRKDDSGPVFRYEF